MMDKPAYPTIPQAFGLLGIYLGLALMFGFFFAGIIKFDGPSQGAVTFMMYVITMTILSIFALKQTNLHWKEIFGSHAGGDLTTYLLLVVLVVANTFIIDPILSFFPVPEWIEELFKELIKPNFGSFLTVVVAAAFLEEYIFRGIVLRGFMQNFSPEKAIIWSAVFFGIFHFNPWQGFAASVLGLYMGWIYYRTRSLWPCIFVHFVNNGFAFLSFTIAGDAEMVLYDFSQNIPVAILSVIAGAAAVYLLYKVLDQRLPAIVEEPPKPETDAQTP